MQVLVIFDKASGTLVLTVTVCITITGGTQFCLLMNKKHHLSISYGYICDSEMNTLLKHITCVIYLRLKRMDKNLEKLIFSVNMLTRSTYGSYFDLGSCKISGKRSLLLKFHVL